MRRKLIPGILLFASLGLLFFFISSVSVSATKYVANCTGNAVADTASFEYYKSAIGSRTGTITVPWTTTRCLLNDLIIPGNITLDFTSNSTGIQIVTGQELTILGSISAPPIQAFYNALSGQGTITFGGNYHHVVEVYADWWIADYTADMAPAIQAANDSLPLIGGIVRLNGTYLVGEPVNVGPFVTLRGNGHQSTSLLALSAFSGAAMIQNKIQDGTQQICNIEGIYVNGNKNGSPDAPGGMTPATVPIGILQKGIGQNSHLRDVSVTNVSGTGIVLDGGSTANSAGYYLNNIWAASNGAGQVVVQGQIQAVTIDTATVEFMPSNTRGIYLDGTSGTEGHQSIWLHNIHLEGDPTTEQSNVIGIDINSMSSVLIEGVDYIGANATTGDLIKIRGTSDGISLINLRAQSLLNLVNDTVNGIVKTVAANPRFQLYSVGKAFISTGTAQADASFTSRTPGNNYAWGHSNPAGFGSTIGNMSISGFPFIAFNAENDTGDTFQTRGLAAYVLYHNLTTSSLLIGRIGNSSAQNQSPVDYFKIKSSGDSVTLVGDAAVATQGKGLVLKASNGANCFRVTVDNAGALSTASATCP